MLWGVSDLEEIRQTRQHVGGDGWDVVDTLTVFQKDPDQQQNRPEGQNHVKFSVFLLNDRRCDHVLTAGRHLPNDGELLPVDEQKLSRLLVIWTCGGKHNRSFFCQSELPTPVQVF